MINQAKVFLRPVHSPLFKNMPDCYVNHVKFGYAPRAQDYKRESSAYTPVVYGQSFDSLEAKDADTTSGETKIQNLKTQGSLSSCSTLIMIPDSYVIRRGYRFNRKTMLGICASLDSSQVPPYFLTDVDSQDPIFEMFHLIPRALVYSTRSY